jgi:hypothetical protein
VNGSHWMFDFGNRNSRSGGHLTSSITIEWTPRASRVVLTLQWRTCCRPAERRWAACPASNESFEPGGMSLWQTGEFWSIMSGAQVLDFGNREYGAKQGMLAFRRYGFSYRCIVGSTGSSFQYLRR